MNSINKSNSQFIILVGIVAGLLSFQNCSQQFASQCTTDCEEWRSVVAENATIAEYEKVSFYDAMQFDILSKAQDLVAHHKLGVVQGTMKSKFFGEEFAAVAYLKPQFQGSIFSIHSENMNAEAAKLYIDSGYIIAEHSSSPNDYYRVKYALPSEPQDLVIGAYFGIRILDIRLVVNGKLIASDDPHISTELLGAPVNYSYLEKNVTASDQSAESLVFNRKLSTYELASVSRHLGNSYSLTNVIYDESIKIDSDVNFIQEREQFMAARNILKANSCFKCHGSWVNYGEYNYISAGLIKENSAANSPLWTRLAGTLEPNKQGKKKDMPLKQKPIKDEELDVIKAWITSFTSG